MSQRTIAAERTGLGTAVGLAALTAVAALAITFGWRVAFSYPVLLLAAGGIGFLLVAVGQRRCRVELADDGLRVTGRFRLADRHFQWDELLEVGWHSPPRNWAARAVGSLCPVIAAGCGVLVRPKGGRFDVPGPNAPVQIATLAIFGPEAEESAREILQTECQRYGVVFSDRGLLMLADAPPGSPLRVPDSPRQSGESAQP